MQLGDARHLLGLSCDATLSEVKAAYRKKVLECHPDRVPPSQKSDAEARFRSVTEAYKCLVRDGGGGGGVRAVPFTRRSSGGISASKIAVGLPFIMLVLGTFSLGGCVAARKYRKDCEGARSRHPFLP